MSLIIETCVGHVHVFSRGEGSKTGMYKFSPSIPDTAETKCLIMGVNLALNEIVQPTVTLDDKRTIYIFGSAWTSSTVSGMLLLGDGPSGSQLDALLQWYDTNRVSKKKAPVTLSMGVNKMEAFVTGLSLNDANAENNTQTFQITVLTSNDA